MHRRFLHPLFLLFILIALPSASPAQGSGTSFTYLPLISNSAPIQQPVLKWKYGGCYASWCETGWYSSPAVADVNGDGKNEVIASAYSLWALNGDAGNTLWTVASPGGRTWPGVVVADIDKDGHSEIVTAQGGGYVSVYTLGGALKWRRPPAGSAELRGVLVADLDGNNSTMEVVVTQASGSPQNTWVLDSSGNTRAGWPQLSKSNELNENGYAWGVYNANLAAGDMDGDGKLELVVPSDVHCINAYKPDGGLVAVNGAYAPRKYWGQVGVWESTTPEQRGWGKCDGVRSESYRTNFADGPAVISDLNGDGKREVVVTGNMYDCHAGYPPSRYMAVFIFNADRTRFNAPGYSWQIAPVDTGAPRSEDYEVIETAEPNPAVADIDGDGKKEIVYASYDGRVHAFWLDKTEHGEWPYAVTKPGDTTITFASEPVIADLQNDRRAEVIFTSWSQKGSGRYGKLHILSSDGIPIFEVDLPAPRSSSQDWNGALPVPTLANIDGDPDLEVIVNTVNSGVVAYDLPGTANARVLWGTGRGNYARTGAQ